MDAQIILAIQTSAQIWLRLETIVSKKVIAFAWIRKNKKAPLTYVEGGLFYYKITPAFYKFGFTRSGRGDKPAASAWFVHKALCAL